MITFKPSDHSQHTLSQKNYYATLTAPLDDMWELGIIAKGSYMSIISEQPIGYLVLNQDKVLLQFHLEDAFKNNAHTIFQSARKQLDITSAFAATYEPWYLSLCLDHAVKVSVNDLLYRDLALSNKVSMPSELIEHTATLDDLDQVVAYTHKEVELSGDWIITYYQDLIKQKGLFLYKTGQDILASGEMRVSQTSVPYANIGMTVSCHHRKKGYGTAILKQMKSKCYAQALKPICSTSVTNIASQHTIARAGFIAENRVLEITF